MTDVGGRTAFITGEGNGIGLGIARAFATAGVLDVRGHEKFNGLADAGQSRFGRMREGPCKRLLANARATPWRKMVLNAVEAECRYFQSERLMYGHIKARAEAHLEAMLQ